MTHQKRWGVFLALGIVLMLIVASCDYKTQVMSDTVPRTQAGATQAAANSGPLDPVTHNRIKQAAIVAGSTNLVHVTGKVTINGSGCSGPAGVSCTGSGTSSAPWVFTNYWLDGCIQVDVPHVSITNNFIYGNLYGCRGRSGSGNTTGDNIISTGNDSGTAPMSDVHVTSNEIRGADTQAEQFGICLICQYGIAEIQGNDLHGSHQQMIISGSTATPTVVKGNYFHDLSKSHQVGGGFPAEIALGGRDCLNFPRTFIGDSTSRCQDDFHGENIWIAAEDHVLIYDNYINTNMDGVTAFGQTYECTSAIFQGAQGSNPVFTADYDVISNNYIRGGDGCRGINSANEANAVRLSWEHNTFGVGGGGNWVGESPCALVDHHSGNYTDTWSNISYSTFFHNRYEGDASTDPDLKYDGVHTECSD